MRSVNTLVLGILLAASSSSLLAQANSAGGVKVAPAAVKTSQQAPKAAATLKSKSAARKPVETSASPADAQAPTYFLREGDQLYDGRVEKIAMDGVSFHELGKDAFGKPVERQVNKRIYASAGEQQ